MEWVKLRFKFVKDFNEKFPNKKMKKKIETLCAEAVMKDSIIKRLKEELYDCRHALKDNERRWSQVVKENELLKNEWENVKPCINTERIK